MNALYIILALTSIPLVFFTLFARSEKGQRVRLGSYYLIKDFTSRVFRVRSLDDKILLITRLLFAAAAAALVINPLELDTPASHGVLHRPAEKIERPGGEARGAVLDLPGATLDSFDEEIFFLEALARNAPGTKDALTIVYNPDEARLKKIKGDMIIFPGPNQDREVFRKWSGIFYFSDIIEGEFKIKDAGFSVKRYYRAAFTDTEKISVYSKLDNDAAVAFSLEDGGRRILFFTMSASEQWGDPGLSGCMMDIIARFQKNIAITEGATDGDLKALGERGSTSGRLPYKTLLYLAILFFIAEILLFIYRSRGRMKAGTAALVFLLLFAASGRLHAGGFVFVELDYNAAPDAGSQLMFSRIKREAEAKTSVKIDPVFYKKITTAELAAGRLPEIPYLWIIGCKGPGFFSGRVKTALSRFMNRGGIIFIDTCGSADDSGFLGEISDFILEQKGYNPEKGLLPKLPADHPIYKSFFLISGGGFSGIDVSLSTKRTALIVSRGNFKKGILAGDELALRTGINVLLYMLSGNYKSDQIHTRQILRKLKQREHYR